MFHETRKPDVQVFISSLSTGMTSKRFRSLAANQLPLGASCHRLLLFRLLKSTFPKAAAKLPLPSLPALCSHDPCRKRSRLNPHLCLPSCSGLSQTAIFSRCFLSPRGRVLTESWAGSFPKGGRQEFGPRRSWGVTCSESFLWALQVCRSQPCPLLAAV